MYTYTYIHTFTHTHTHMLKTHTHTSKAEKEELTSPCPLDDIGKPIQGVEIHRSPRPVQYDADKKDSQKRTSPREGNAGKSGGVCGLCAKKPPVQVDNKQTETVAEADDGVTGAGVKGKGINCEDHLVPVTDPNSIMYPKPNPPSMPMQQQPQIAFIPVMTTSPVGYNGFGSNPLGAQNLVYSITNGAFANNSPGPYMYDNLEDPAQYMYDPQAAYNKHQQQQMQQGYYGAPSPNNQQYQPSNNNSAAPVGSSPPGNNNIPMNNNNNNGGGGGYGANPGVNPQSGQGGIPRLNLHTVSSNVAYTTPSPTSYLTMVSTPVSYVQQQQYAQPSSVDYGSYGNVGYA